ncbi:hypothetical protein C4D60_Mb06t23420 [Musa balbisiana]|uniref:Uncharacterized protein n=1 Tax=Musa balbisiana TaxID=52838 RepID=A0A4S8ISM5_MUSBA|nr:hypothetical protein C4D60_Mb06t23420 [Musa balbisiana]
MATETTHSVRPPQFSVSFSSELAAVPPYTVASIKLTATNSIRPPKSSSDLASKREMKPSASETETSDSFVAVDIDELSQQLMANIKDRSSSTPRVVSKMMKKNLSRKGSQGSGAEREKNKTEQGDHHQGTGDESALSIRVATDGEAASLNRASGPTAEAGRRRRVGSRRPPSPWLDPSRVVIVFAALSSMGTLILLYFTLFMGKVTSANENAW